MGIENRSQLGRKAISTRINAARDKFEESDVGSRVRTVWNGGGNVAATVYIAGGGIMTQVGYEAVDKYSQSSSIRETWDMIWSGGLDRNRLIFNGAGGAYFSMLAIAVGYKYYTEKGNRALTPVGEYIIKWTASRAGIVALNLSIIGMEILSDRMDNILG